VNVQAPEGRVRVKICGVVSPADALAAVDAGADLIGFNFVPESKRFISLEKAKAIHASLASAKVETVALFRNAAQEEVARILDAVAFDWVQFHGEETPEEISGVVGPVIKALRGADAQEAARFPSAVLLLDHPVESGGGGQDWDWSAARGLIEQGRQVILAGGLRPGNVEAALRSLGGIMPWAVDVASGVELDSAGKDPAKMKAFVEAVRAVQG
jgi:phosphoribosylanthranilate isomerase